MLAARAQEEALAAPFETSLETSLETPLETPLETRGKRALEEALAACLFRCRAKLIIGVTAEVGGRLTLSRTLKQQSADLHRDH